MWKSASLPYKSNTNVVTLPTTEEIRACQDVLHERLASKVVALNDKVVAEYGFDIDPLEGQALSYLERHVPRIPAPRLYAMYYESDELFVVMQRVPGIRLDRLWASLTDDEKDSIVAQLQHTFARLRQTPCPKPHWFGGLDGGAIRHYLFYSQRDEEKHLGPSGDGPAFVKSLTDNFRALKEANDHPDLKVRFYEGHLPGALAGIHPILTHGDVKRKNIMVHDNGRKAANAGRQFDITLIDWEMAGWLPEIWEYFSASISFQYASWDDDWCLRVGHFLPVQLAQTAVMRMFDQDAGC